MRGTTSALLLALALLVSASVASGATLVITRVLADEGRTTLTVSGANLCSDPAVTIARRPQQVVSGSDTTVVLRYPELPPGSYTLVLVCGSASDRTSAFPISLPRR